MDEIHIKACGDEYEATLSRLGCPGTTYPGRSPDEALGYAVRELWLGQDEVVTFRLTMDDNPPEPRKAHRAAVITPARRPARNDKQGQHNRAEP